MSSQLDDKIRELESKREKRNYSNLIGFFIILGIFAVLYFYTRGVKIEKDADNEKALVEKSKEADIYIAKENKDSIIQFTSEVYVEELENIKQRILTSTPADRSAIISSIDSIQKLALQVSKLATDSIPVRYYRRPNDDSNAIMEVIRGTETPTYYFDSIYRVNDDKRVNTIYYGELVNKNYIDTLVAKLKKRKVPIKNVKQFKGKRGYDWKKVTVQLEYEIDSSSIDTVKNHQLNIKFYSYKPNKKAKIIARKVLANNQYNVEVFPDWERQMSFFSKYPVVLYYTPENESVADRIAKELRTATGVNFVAESGDGIGVSKEERSTLFIIHYNGS
ncbi:hypothetical protein [Dokdonia sp.]|uniref:hypothetical protein n=1 Tax=Dokdonia sp. TaxID=2024995 RepID=UPI003263F92B